MRIGMVFPQTELGGDASAVRAYGQRVEELGFIHLLAYDHVVGADPEVHTGPWLSRSTSAACMATSTVCRCGRMTTLVTSSSVVVTAARYPNMTSGSWNVVCTSYGPSQPVCTSGSAPTTWS